MTAQTSTAAQDVTVDPRISVVAYNLFALEVGFSKLDLAEFAHSAAKRQPWEAQAVDYLAQYDADAAEAQL